jgi:hypothetical protein
MTTFLVISLLNFDICLDDKMLSRDWILDDKMSESVMMIEIVMHNR